MDKEKKITVDPELSCLYFAKYFYYTIEKDIKHKNIYNLPQKRFLMGRYKH